MDSCCWTYACLIVLRATKTLDVLIFSKKKVLSDVRSEIHFVLRNIVSTGQPLRALKKLYLDL